MDSQSESEEEQGVEETKEGEADEKPDEELVYKYEYYDEDDNLIVPLLADEELVYKYEYYDEDNNLIDPSMVDQATNESQSGYESSHGDGGGKPRSIEEQDRLNKPDEGRGAAWRAGRRRLTKYRYNEIRNMYSEKGFVLLIKNKEIWGKKCTGVLYKPSCACRKCKKTIENPPSIDNMERRGFQCPYCVKNERKQQQNGRPANQGHPCDGSCGKKDCNKSFTNSSNLKRHQEKHLKKYICPVLDCPKHEEGYSTNSDMLIHFRDKHPDLCKSDGRSCLEYGILPKRTSRLKKPTKYNGKVTDAEWRFLKQLVNTCIKNDITAKDRWTEEDQEYLEKIKTNEYKHQITEKILDILLERKLIKNSCVVDDAGGYLPNGFVLDRHSLYKLSLDRKDNDRPHFLPNTNNILENLSLIIIGMNTATNIVSIHTENTCDYVREKVEESQQKTKEDEDNLVSSQSKKYNKINNSIASTLYSCCATLFSLKIFSRENKGEYRDKKCRKAFKTPDNFFKHCYSLLEKQRGYCAISGIFLENETTGLRSPFKLSVDAIKPRDGHVPGNIRIICQFLNSINNDKIKTHVAEDDRETAWTPELFKEYFQIPE